ncbi:MAG: hypothetical protein KDA85_14070, partial [Planctomycetaceae bacterium]|nr:hypothetical protein [Planctomycetaceae bacterium]
MSDRYSHVLATYRQRKVVSVPATLWILTILGFLAVPSREFTAGTHALQVVIYATMMMVSLFFAAHLKQCLTRTQSVVMPQHQQTHLVIAIALWLLPGVTGTLCAIKTGQSIEGTLTIVWFIWLAGFWQGIQPGFLSVTPVAVALLLLCAPHGIEFAVEILYGRHPAISAGMLIAELVASVAIFRRLNGLTEDDPAFGQVMPMDPGDLRSAAVRTRQRATLQDFSGLMEWYLAPISRRLDRLTKRPARTLRERIALLQLTDDWPSNAVYIILLMGVIQTPPIVIGRNTPEQLTAGGAHLLLTIPVALSLGLTWVT